VRPRELKNRWAEREGGEKGGNIDVCTSGAKKEKKGGK